MPRNGPATRRELQPDPVYRSVLVTQVVNKVLSLGNDLSGAPVPTIVNGSDDPSLDTAMCQDAPKAVSSANARCGFGQRLPLVVISPYARADHVSGNLTDTTSVVKFIEDNWLHGERIPGSYDAISGSLDAPGGVLDFHGRPNLTRVILNPDTGAVVRYLGT